jgi:hypothetical protein
MFVTTTAKSYFISFSHGPESPHPIKLTTTLKTEAAGSLKQRSVMLNLNNHRSEISKLT